MNRSELQSLLKSAEYDFERRFDERWALEWMQENWWVQKCRKGANPGTFSVKKRGRLGSAGTINAAYYVIAVDWE